jgi:exopolyphosphatase/guanosine-5'-triphosphate,3'-diphosphate pyrophosphatase
MYDHANWMKRVGIIDIGSNSIKLLVAERGEEGVVARSQKTIETRIGGSFTGEAIPVKTWELALEAVCELQDLAAGQEVDGIRVVGTSALRDAANGSELSQHFHRLTGLDLQILSGEEEAFFIGRGIATDPHWQDCEDYAVMDQGGGSLEIILFVAGQLHQAVSLPLGAVRLFHRYQNAKAEPFGREVIDSCAEECARLLEDSGIDWTLAGLRPWAGAGGAFTMTRLVHGRSLKKEFDQTDPWLSTETIRETTTRLAGMSMEDRIGSAGLPPNRADIMPISLVPVLEALRLAQADRIMHSVHNLRYGLAADMLEEGGKVD